MSGIATMIADWMPDEVTVQGYTTTDDDGDPILGAQQEFIARVQADPKLVRMQDGTERKTSTVVYTNEEVFEGDFMWLEGSDTSSADGRMEVLQVTKSHDKRASTFLYKSRIA